MIARLLICTSLDKLRKEISHTLASHLTNGNTVHPDILYFKQGEKLGIAEARKIKQHFSLKPYSAPGRAVIIEDAASLTAEAQNALLKTLEEPPKEAILLLGATSEANLLPTVLSRCQITHLDTPSYDTLEYHNEDTKNLERLLNSSTQERFEYVEKLKDREEFLHYLIASFRGALLNLDSPLTDAIVHHIGKEGIKNFLKELLQAEEWAKQNVNIRAILEYLMLKMPTR